MGFRFQIDTVTMELEEIPFLKERFDKYRNDPAVKDCLAVLDNPETCYFYVGKISYAYLNRLHIDGYALTFESDTKTPSKYIQMAIKRISKQFEAIPSTNGMFALAYLIAQLAQTAGTQRSHYYETVKEICYCPNSWFDELFQCDAIELNLRNRDFAEIIYLVADTYCSVSNEYELRSAKEIEFLNEIYLKLRKISSRFKRKAIENTEIFKEELLSNALHPKRIGPLIDTYGIEVLEWGF